MQKHPPPDWQGRLLELVRSCQEREDLEEIGRALNQEQWLHLLDSYDQLSSEPTEIISPILVGLAPVVFYEGFLTAPENSLENLRSEAATEPLQHQITMLGHELHRILNQLSDRYEEHLQKIENAVIEKLGPKDIDQLRSEMNADGVLADRCATVIQKVLNLVWITGRVDLIESFSHSMEGFQRLLAEGYGSVKIPTSLHALLNQKLLNIYGDIHDPNDREALSDEEPAFEALAKLGIWYLTDYFEIGLLPSVTSQDDLQLDPKQHPNEECVKHRENLFETARNHMKLKGLETVSDLKEHQIFSRIALIEYLQK